MSPRALVPGAWRLSAGMRGRVGQVGGIVGGMTTPVRPLTLEVIPGTFAVCRLPAGAPLPAWASDSSPWWSVTRSENELSIVAPEHSVPQPFNGEIERGWAALRVAGTLEFSEIGILARLTRALAESRISVFAISTFDTDYLLVKQVDLTRAIDAWRSEGIEIDRGSADHLPSPQRGFGGG